MSAPTTTSTILAEIRVPRETVNDDTVTVQSWHAAHGARVTTKQLVASIETSKAVLEIEADAEGYLEITHPAGAEVPIGELIGRVVAEPPTAAPTEPRAQASSASSSAVPETNGHTAPPRSSNRLRDRAAAQTGQPSTSEPQSTPAPLPAARNASTTTHSLPTSAPTAQTISKKAQRLIDEHAMNPAQVFAGLGLVREVDVIRHLESAAAARLEASPMPPSPATLAQQTPPPRIAASNVNSAYTPTKSKGLFGDAASSAKDRGNRSVLWLAWNYLWRNWFLGHAVRVAPRGVILTLHRWRGVKMGQDVFIDPTSIIETAFPENITIGNDVRITARCVIMSHIKAPHYLRETGLVPVVLRPVILEDHCFIGVNSVIMPGVTVGKASVVTSGSVVVNNVPPYTMVQGNPAKVIKQFPRPE